MRAVDCVIYAAPTGLEMILVGRFYKDVAPPGLGVLPPLRGGEKMGCLTGGLRCAATSGYFLASLRLAFN
jgi:hypothetical protein